ncbi:hypothetical protein EXIGLDRAFT_752219 [Exidia glandulosa HHB12029]|uniref:Uncharacterized protein n=1 Tax=Exidia glandulosa HHB12029 TaxID=1314781 RepID=A0A166A0N2_EXIGL|nr:hypothetical protein EXIGLDRAFT_752219 [Exidia glandulosa HHB12029]
MSTSTRPELGRAADGISSPSTAQRGLEVQRAPNTSQGLLDPPDEAVQTISQVAVSQLEQNDIAHDLELDLPIRRLPVELLIAIFTDAIVTSDFFGLIRRAGRPFAIACTCRQWRDIVLHKPDLWSMIDYEIKELSTLEDEERVSRSLRLHIERSSRLPLDVCIDLRSKPSSLNGQFWSTLSTLFRRARVFQFTTTVNVHSTLTSQVLSQHAPYLSRLAFSEGDYRFAGKQVLELSLDAPCLRPIECEGAPVQLFSGPYPSVRSARLHSDLLPSIFFNLFKWLPNLVDLDIYWYDGPTRSHATLELEYLETLIIGGRNSFFYLDLARLFSFPSLHKASIKFGFDNQPNTIDPRAVTAFIRSALHTVRSLELDLDAGPYCDVSSADVSSAIVDGLKSCTHLEHLTLHVYAGDAAFAALSTPHADGAWLCPRLRSVSAYIGRSTLDSDIFIKETVSLAAARRATGLTKMEIILKEYSANYGRLLRWQDRLNGILLSPEL